MSNDPIAELDVHRFIDGELPADEAEAMAARLASDPALAALVDQYRADMALMARAYDPVLSWTLPVQPENTVVPLPRLRIPLLWRGAAIAAAIVIAFGIQRWSAAPSGDGLVLAAITAYDDQATPEASLDRPQEAMAETNSAIAQHLGVAASAPDLTKAGWTLAKVGFYQSSRAGRFVELRYIDAGRHRFTIALQGKQVTPRFDISRNGKLWVCVWQSDELEAVMLGEMSRHDMLSLSNKTYSALGL
jgi:anti-sigma factor RsiW